MEFVTTNGRRFWTNSAFRNAKLFGAAPTNSSVRISAAMQTRKELEQMGMATLVAQCGKIVNDASKEEETRAKAWQLKLECASPSDESRSLFSLLRACQSMRFHDRSILNLVNH
jgi:hypothetical protein